MCSVQLVNDLKFMWSFNVVTNKLEDQMAPSAKRGICKIPTCLCETFCHSPGSIPVGSSECSVCQHQFSYHKPFFTYVLPVQPDHLSPITSSNQLATANAVSLPTLTRPIGVLSRFEHQVPTFVPPNRSLLSPIEPSQNSEVENRASQIAAQRTSTARHRALLEIQRGGSLNPIGRRRTQNQPAASAPRVTPDVEMKITILRHPHRNPYINNNSHVRTRLQSRGLDQMVVMLNPADTAEVLREKVIARIQAISPELCSKLTGYKLWSPNNRQDYRPIFCSMGQTENLKFIRDNAARSSSNIFYIGPRDNHLPWSFIFSLPVVPEAEPHRSALEQAWQGWQQDDENEQQVQEVMSLSAEAPAHQGLRTTISSLSAPSTLPQYDHQRSTLAAGDFSMLSQLQSPRASHSERISLEAQPPYGSNQPEAEGNDGPLELIHDAMNERWLIESGDSDSNTAATSRYTLRFGDDEQQWLHEMHAALDVDYLMLLPRPKVRVQHVRYQAAADFGGVFRAFFSEWLEAQAKALCSSPENIEGSRMPVEDVTQNRFLVAQRNQQQLSWETFGKVIALAVLHLGFSAWPYSLDPTILILAIANHKGIKYRPATRYFTPDYLLYAVFSLLDQWIETGGQPENSDIPARVVSIVTHVFGTTPAGAKAILQGCVTEEACLELGVELYSELEWKQREGILAAFTRGLNWSEVLDVLEDLDDFNFDQLESSLRTQGIPVGEAILQVTDFKFSEPYEDTMDRSFGNQPLAAEHQQLCQLFSTWIRTATPMQRRWFITSATGGSRLADRLTIKTVKNNTDSIFEDMRGHLLAFRTCEMTVMFAWAILDSFNTDQDFARFMEWHAQGDGLGDFNTV
jgi:hypothetical protein